MDIFISNGGFRGTPVRDSVMSLVAGGFKNIELSTGYVTPDDLMYLRKLRRKGHKFRLHNYFPNLTDDFVMNLASTNDEVRNKTQALILTALEWSSEIESNYYAFHAGFLFDPMPNELGGNLKHHTLSRYEESAYIFKEQLYYLRERAATLGVVIAVENNVYDKSNYNKYQQDIPFLAVCESNIENFLIDGVGLLLDFAHLKVSATTLNKDYHKICQCWLPHVTGFHLSDNNGLRDENKFFSKSSWFLEYLHRMNCPITLEVYDYEWKELHKMSEIVATIMDQTYE